MNAYEMAIAITNNPAAFQAEMAQRSAAHLEKIAAAAATVRGLTEAEHAAYHAAIKNLPHAYISKSGKTMKPVPVDEIGMAAVSTMRQAR